MFVKMQYQMSINILKKYSVKVRSTFIAQCKLYYILAIKYIHMKQTFDSFTFPEYQKTMRNIPAHALSFPCHLMHQTICLLLLMHQFFHTTSLARIIFTAFTCPLPFQCPHPPFKLSLHYNCNCVCSVEWCLRVVL